MQTKNKNSVLKLSLLLAIIIALILGYLYYQEKSNKQFLEKRFVEETQEILATSRMLDSLERELDASMEEVKRLGGELSDYELLKSKISSERTQISTLSTSEISELRERIKLYESMLHQKDEQLKRLIEENAQIKSSFNALEVESSTLKETNSKLKEEKKSLKDTVEIVKKNVVELNEKVALAAILKPVNISVSSINKKGKEKETIKAGKFEQLRISFQLATNPLTTKENKTIYVRLLDTQGNVISDTSLGSGSFILEGKPTIYTLKKTFAYTNTNQTVDIFYYRELKYGKGIYTVELYSENYKIGTKTFEVR